MTTTDSRLSAQGESPGSLSVDDISKIIATAKAASSDPVSSALQILLPWGTERVSLAALHGKHFPLPQL
jgi:hypothetical protein